MISSFDGYLNEVDGPQGCRKLASIVSGLIVLHRQATNDHHIHR